MNMSQSIRAARTEYHRLSGLYTTDIYFPSTGSWEVQDQHSVSDESVLPDSYTALFTMCPHKVKGVKKVSRSLL